MNKGLTGAIKLTMIFIVLLVSLFFIYNFIKPTSASEVLPAIWTADPNGVNKTDFSPEEKVYIEGENFLASTQVTISVTRPDGVIDTGYETTDPYGAFEYEYTLDGITGTYDIFANDGINTATISFNDSSGAIWTTKNDCGNEQQDINHFNVGDHVYINGAGFSSGSKSWSIKGTPGSCDSNIVVASGNVNINSSGAFCFDAYIVQVGDCGVYQVKVDTKGDNYQVGDWCDKQTTEKKCGDSGCLWCQQCKYDVSTTKANQWLTVSCVLPGTDCGWHCEKGYCGATCSNGLDCSCPADKCVGLDYYDYPLNGTCKDCTTSCYCENGTAVGQPCYPTIVKNDPKCGECKTDDDCNKLDKDYCDGTLIKHDEGKCIDYFCKVSTTTIQNCDNGLYCDGQETCLNAACVKGTTIDCSYLCDKCQEGKCDESLDKCVADYSKFPLSTPCESDNNKCTVDHCNGSGSCVFWKDYDCNDNNACTSDSCDSVLGCQHVPVNCDDSNVCTQDSCDTITGCSHTPIPNCCKANSDCNDSNACTNDVCTNNQCQHSTVTCNDGVGCTEDSCDTVKGCIYKPNDGKCPTDTTCSDYYCDAILDCKVNYAPLSTPCEADSSKCTIDHCNGSGSCVFWKDVIVPPAEQCKTFYCDPTTGEIKENYTDATEVLYESKPNSVYVDGSATNVSYKLCNASDYIGVDTSDGVNHYIYMKWSNINFSKYVGVAYFNLTLNHYEASTVIKVQLKNQTGAWIDVCDPPESTSYIWSDCNLMPYIDIIKSVPVIELRVVAKETGTCHEYLACAKIKAKFYECKPKEFCGDGIVKPPEKCELPNTNDNPFCTQTTTECLGKKLGQRDALGNCDSLCGCIDDSFKYSCVQGQCGATCDDNADCQNKCVNDVLYNAGNCLDSCDCSWATQNCNLQDGCYVYDTGCENRDYFCQIGGCNYTFSGRNTDYNDSFVNYCSVDALRKHRTFHDFFCDSNCKDHTSWIDDQLVQDCNLQDGWYNTSTTQWVNITQCTDKEQLKQEYRDYTCTPKISAILTPAVPSCTYTVNDTKWIDTGVTKPKPLSTPCSDGNWCSETDHCDGNGNCVQLTARDCSEFDLKEIAQCNWIPDGFTYTFDYAAAFTSVCDEVNDKCTKSSQTLTHTCADANASDSGPVIPVGNGIRTCDAECDGFGIECQNKCIGDVRYFNGNCDLTGCSCSYQSENCDKDGCYVYDNGCEQRDYYCTVDGCKYDYSNRYTDFTDEQKYYCSDSTIRKHRLFHDFYCNGACSDHTSWIDDQLVENCDLKDGWYNTSTTQWLPVGECADKEQLKQEYRDYTCKDATCDYKVTDNRWIDTGKIKNKELSTPCEAEGNLCTIDHCNGSGQCVKKNDVDCSGLNNQCQEGVCNPSNGQCYPDYNKFPLSTPCEFDNNKCTIDHCDGKGLCLTFDNVPVPAPEECKSFYCDSSDGKVKEDYTDFPLSTPCPSGDACKINHCDGLGECVFWKDVPIPSKPIKIIGDPKTRCNEGEWCEWRITTLTPITLTCEEGKIHWRYALDEEWKNWNDDGSSVTIYFPEESNHTLEAYCLNDCSESEHDIEKFKVDGTAFEIPLYKKWNLISVPFVLTNDSISEVFKNISDKIAAVWTYDNGFWYVWIPGLGGTLESIKPGWGYWVAAKEDTKLLIAGSLLSPTITPPSKDLQTGWNLIGYYGTEWQTYEIEKDNVCGYINPVYGNYVYCSLNSLINTQQGFPRWSSLWGYDNCGDDLAYWHELESCISDQWSDNRMYAGKGYWIEMDVKDSYAPATNCIWNEDLHCSSPTI